ncbi:MAG: PspC domain-containing protein [Candidatus Promineifilaceae bacterium]
MQTRLVRSETDKMIAGVCGGIAAYLNVDSVLVRFAFIMLIFASGIGLPLYLILAFIMPQGNDIVPNIYRPDQEVEEQIKIYDEETVPLKANAQKSGTLPHPQGPVIFAFVLIAIGVYLLAQNIGFLNWLNFGWLGPLIIIGIGIYLIFRRRR